MKDHNIVKFAIRVLLSVVYLVMELWRRKWNREAVGDTFASSMYMGREFLRIDTGRNENNVSNLVP